MAADGIGHGGRELAQAVREAYRDGQTDYGLEPIVVVDPDGRPVGRVQDGDAVIFCCRRGEREIQLTEAFVDPSLDRFPRRVFRRLTFVILTLYHEKFRHLPVAFAPVRVADTLGEVVSRAGLRQMRLAESEKFAHVTFFFSGGDHHPFPREDRTRVPSPRGVPFDTVPALSLPLITARLLTAIERRYDLIVANLANGDVIGHTPNTAAKLECARQVDAHLGRIVPAALAAGYVTLVTADHGILEVMATADGKPNVSHTTNPVPCLLIGDPAGLRSGGLADVAPTVLELLGLAKPAAMTGHSLLAGRTPHPPARPDDETTDAPSQPASVASGRTAASSRRRVLLLILDGWGIGAQDATNPIGSAETPVWNELVQRYLCTQLEAAGQAVGLKAGKAGNSEAGHMNLGAGRVVLQDDVRLDLAMQDGSFYSNETLGAAIDQVRERQTALHLIALLTEKSSHGSTDYPLAVLRMAHAAGLGRAYVHVITDGRSTQPGSAPALLEKLETQVAEIGLGQVVSVMGRGIALDRDGNYEKTRRAYDALVFGTGRAWPAGQA